MGMHGKGAGVKKSSYLNRDYNFGQTMLTLRTRIGLTQAGLADYLGVSRRAVGDWESGSSYPRAEHLKEFIALAFRHQAFTHGRVIEEVHALWQAAHQKILFDDIWFAAFLPQSEVTPSSETTQESTAGPFLGQRVDWSVAPAVPTFYGRELEMDLLTGWIVTERCRVVSVLGLGGVGKSALANNWMRQIADDFEVVTWRSLRDFSTWEELLNELHQVLVPQSFNGEPVSILQCQNILLEQIRKTRILLVLDNLEAALEAGEGMGRMRPGFEGLERALRLAAETEHQSCILLTSREEPAALVPLESSQAPVRVMRLGPLDIASCKKMLSEKGVKGSPSDWAQFIKAYTGNPLALKIAAQTVVDLFDGEIAPFLEQGEIIFGGIRDLLGEQFARLSSIEQDVLLRMAILGEPTTFDELSEGMVQAVPRARLFEAVGALRNRSLIEPSKRKGSFSLQLIMMEYLTAQLIPQAGSPDG
jgi:transcriptional regulator with XRE-family HTH domain